MPSRERKEEYFTRMESLLDTYNKIIFVSANNVGSQQFHKIRKDLRGTAQVLMGKNTMMRKIVQNFNAKNGGDHPVSNLIPLIKGNIGMIFTNDDLSAVVDVVHENRVGAPAKAGAIAEVDVVVPPGPTGCDPGQTSWFQALNVPTKIQRGQIEIVSELKVITRGEKVGSSEAQLLQKLGIKPFTYGLKLEQVYDNGSVFDAAVLSITEDDLEQKFFQACRRMAAISMAAGYPTMASLPHSVGGAVRRIMSIAAASGYRFSQMAEYDALLPKDTPPKEKATEEAAAAPAAAAGGGY